MLNENLKKQLVNTYKFSNHDINELVWFLRKGIYPYEYICLNGKKSAKRHYLKNKIFTVTLTLRYYWCRLHAHKKSL